VIIKYELFSDGEIFKDYLPSDHFQWRLRKKAGSRLVLERLSDGQRHFLIYNSSISNIRDEKDHRPEIHQNLAIGTVKIGVEVENVPVWVVAMIRDTVPTITK